MSRYDSVSKHSHNVAGSTQGLTHCTLVAVQSVPDAMQPSSCLPGRHSLIPHNGRLLHGSDSHVDNGCLRSQETQQQAQIQLAVLCFGIEPPMPALDVIITPDAAAEHWPQIAANVCQNTPMDTLLSCFPQLFKNASECFTEAKVKGYESCLWRESSRVRIFHEAKVLGTFAPEERKFQGCKSSMEWKFLDFSLPGSECSTQQKFDGSESSLCGLFAPGNESASGATKRPGFTRNTATAAAAQII